MAQPVYSFLGYKLLEVNYKNNLQHSNTYISISCSGKLVDKDLYILNVKVCADFIPDEESSFLFESAFRINDKEWFNELDDKPLQSILFSVVFPFIREKIFTITSDINQGLFIPTLDLKSIDVSKGIKLNRK